jgi:hypothetical protein
MRARSSALSAIFGVLLVVGSSACSITEGALLVRLESDAGSRADAPSGGSVSASPAGAPAPPPSTEVQAGMSLQYQITGKLDTAVDAQLFIVDLFDTQSSQIRALHAAGRVVIAYVSVGTLERWRADATAFPASAVGSTLAAYPDEAWLDTRAASVRSAMRARFEYARQQGFDGVFASTVGAYRRDSGFALDRDDELDYLRFLSDNARALQLSIGLSGDFELSADLTTLFDWALATGCLAANSCDELSPLAAAGVPLFDLELDGDRASMCQRADGQGISVTFKRRDDDAFRAACP